MRAAAGSFLLMKSLLLPVLLLSVSLGFQARAEDARAQQLAKEVWKASGGENWSQVKRLQFTFIVEDQGKELVSATHDWDVAAQTDHVKWKDKDVTVNLANPGNDENAKAAYARWTNDAYWLLAPLKVLDPGVTLTAEGKKSIDGAELEALRMQFGKVGLTPNDQYVLYVDPATKLVRSWDYSPKPDTTMHATWDKYQDFGGLQLSTYHDFGGKVIRFADIKVER